MTIVGLQNVWRWALSCLALPERQARASNNNATRDRSAENRRRGRCGANCQALLPDVSIFHCASGSGFFSPFTQSPYRLRPVSTSRRVPLSGQTQPFLFWTLEAQLMSTITRSNVSHALVPRFWAPHAHTLAVIGAARLPRLLQFTGRLT